MIPMLMVQATGTREANGLLVEIDGIVCKNPLKMKNRCITFFICWIKVTGRKLKIVYFVVLTKF